MTTHPPLTVGNDGIQTPPSHRFVPNRKPHSSSAELGRMPWSWRLGNPFGVVVYIHATFIILLGWLLLLNLSQGKTLAETTVSGLVVMAVFGCIVLHELGHALAARRFGIRTLDITLLPIGGMARMERIPRAPMQELIITIAGPAVNVAIGILLFGAIRVTGVVYGGFGSKPTEIGNSPLIDLMHINAMLAIFNLLPAFPMDGGRILRAVLAIRLPYIQATRIASNVGRAMAVLFGIVGFLGAPMLLLIALFVYQGAVSEYEAVRLDTTIEGLVARDAMLSHFQTLRNEDTLSIAIEMLKRGKQHEFPVLDGNDRFLGMLYFQDMIAALGKVGGAALPVSKLMRHIDDFAKPDEALAPLLARLQISQIPALPVLSGGKLLGLLTMENLAKVVTLQNALTNARAC